MYYIFFFIYILVFYLKYFIEYQHLEENVYYDTLPKYSQMYGVSVTVCPLYKLHASTDLHQIVPTCALSTGASGRGVPDTAVVGVDNNFF